MSKLKLLVLFADKPSYSTFSYHMCWPEQLHRHGGMNCTLLNVAQAGLFPRLRQYRFRDFSKFDAIVILHSVFSNTCLLGGKLFERIAEANTSKVFFVGNEYKLIPEKIEFARNLKLDLFISQCNDPDILSLYRSKLGCEVTDMPNTGLDTEMFRPVEPRPSRLIDIGYRSVAPPLYLGHNERELIADRFRRLADEEKLVADISLDGKSRFAPADWAKFLNSCKAQLGTEAGTDYFDPEDRPRNAVNDYLKIHPGASLLELQENVLSQFTKMPCRIISGRNIEAAGTRTVQILFEGRYGGYFEPDVHYISLKKDFSNIEEVMVRFYDIAFCEKVAEEAYQLVLECFTYDKLIDRLLTLINGM